MYLLKKVKDNINILICNKNLFNETFNNKNTVNAYAQLIKRKVQFDKRQRIQVNIYDK